MVANADRYRLQLLGSFALRRANGLRVEVTSKRGMALIALLATAPHGERSRAWLQSMLWGSRAFEQAQASLRRELANLKASGCDVLIDADRHRIALDLSVVDCDTASSSVVGPPAGEFLEGMDLAGENAFEDWLREQREYLRARTIRPMNAQPRAEVRSLQPSLALLRFRALSGDLQDEVLAAAFGEAVGVALAGYPTVAVIPTTATLPSNDADEARSLSTRLGVTYLLDGTLTHVGERIRLSVHLLRGPGARRLWAQTFDATVETILDVQSEAARAIAPQVDAALEAGEREAALRAADAGADVYAMFWRANALFRQWTPGSLHSAIALVDGILLLEPNNAWAFALGGFCHASVFASGWAEHPDAHRVTGQRYYDLALRHGGDDTFVLGYAAATLIGLGGELDAADRLIARALEIQPISTPTLFWGGWVDVARSDFARAKQRFEMAMAYSPRTAGRPYSLTGIGVCLIALGQPNEAVPLLDEAIQHLPEYPITIAALCLALTASGRAEAAAPYAKSLRAPGRADAVLAVLRDPGHRASFAHAVGIASPALAEVQVT